MYVCNACNAMYVRMHVMCICNVCMYVACDVCMYACMDVHVVHVMHGMYVCNAMCCNVTDRMYALYVCNSCSVCMYVCV